MEFWVGSERINVNMPDMSALESEIARRFAASEGFALATLNLDHLVKLGRDGPFRTAYRAQDLVTADGNPIVWMSRVAGQPVTLLPGSDLVLPLCRLAVAHGVKIGLVGSTDDSLDRAAAAMVAAVPGLEIAVRIAPPMGFDPATPAAEALLTKVRDAGVGLCFLAFGAPKQEILAARGRTRCPTVGFASIGAGLDFLSGEQKRAPRWVRRIAMEWLWRMLSQPRRLAKRYWQSALVLPGHMWRSVRSRD